MLCVRFPEKASNLKMSCIVRVMSDPSACRRDRCQFLTEPWTLDVSRVVCRMLVGLFEETDFERVYIGLSEHT